MSILNDLFGFGGRTKEPVTAAQIAEAKAFLAKDQVEEKSIKEKYLAALKRFENTYAVSQKTIGYTVKDSARQQFLTDMMDRLPHFKYRDAVEHVFSSIEHFGGVSQMFEQMEKSLKNPSNTTLKRFNEVKNKYESSINANFTISNIVIHFNTADFRHVITSIHNTDFPALLFNQYCELSQLETDYFAHICKLEKEVVAVNVPQNQDPLRN
jgi:hypothetical protein